MRGTTEGANTGTGGEEGSPQTPVANDVIGVAGVWRAEGLAEGLRWGGWLGREEGATTAPDAPSSLLALL